jgi:glucosamine kinase
VILIADSGSTKADWVVLSEGRQVFATSTAGLNPLFRSKEEIRITLRSVNFFREFAGKIKHIKFYGAGCGNKNGKVKVQSVLKGFFRSAKVDVRTDLTGAALATCGNKEGIICILGTGSNCCYFDGKKIHLANGGLGYILGDEASGTYFGRKLLQKFLYGQMPAQMSKEFKKAFRVTRESVIENIYFRPNANRYLASFAPFILNHEGDKKIQEMIRQGLEEFYDANISSVKGFEKLPVHFVGSVAFHLRDFVGKLCRRKNLMKGRIMHKPIEGLSEYYLKKKN